MTRYCTTLTVSLPAACELPLRFTASAEGVLRSLCRPMAVSARALCQEPGDFPGARGDHLAFRQGAIRGRRCARPAIVSAPAFRSTKEGRFSESYTDFFDNPAWDEVRRRAQRKAIEMRSQGWSGAAMLPYSELEYGGFRDTVSALLKRFRLHQERKPEAAE